MTTIKPQKPSKPPIRNDYYPSDATTLIDIYNIYNISNTEINNINNNIITFKNNEDSYKLVQEQINLLKNKLIILKNYYEKTNKAFNNRPRKEINAGFISFED